MYETILVPTDGSEAARAAVDQAADIASNYGARIHALYVVDIDATNVTLGTEQVERLKQGHLDEMPELTARAEDATGYVTDVAATHGIDVEEHVLVGYPVRAIRRFVEDHDVDLIVMGSHGRSGLSRVVLGSVSEKVLRQTHLPVLVVDVQGEAADG
ncbi:MAG: universal stress protein [Haloferacaceae archaeon]|jgi:nucleotide-binding universal stress UspA family protein